MDGYFTTDSNGFVVLSTTKRDELVSICRDSARMCAEDGFTSKTESDM